MTNVQKSGKKPAVPQPKPYMKGSPVDGNTVSTALKFCLAEILGLFLVFLLSNVFQIGNIGLRVVVCMLIEVLYLAIFYNSAVPRGSEAVSRGEIFLGREEKAHDVTPAERASCYHPLKGYVTGILGTLPLLICAIILALTAEKQTTGVGVLPAWLSTYERRSDIGDALVAYNTTAGLSLQGLMRVIVRVALMPFIVMAGADNHTALLLIERLSPVLVLLPALAYGTGYLGGPKERARVHAEIEKNNRRKAKQESKKRKARSAKPREPEQLN